MMPYRTGTEIYKPTTRTPLWLRRVRWVFHDNFYGMLRFGWVLFTILLLTVGMFGAAVAVIYVFIERPRVKFIAAHCQPTPIYVNFTDQCFICDDGTTRCP